MFSIRRAVNDDASGIARVQVDTWRTAYAGIMPVERLAQLSYERSAAHWEGQIANPDNIVHIAEVDGATVGFAASGKERDNAAGYDSEIYAIYVLEAYQGNGIGRELIHSAAKELGQRGYQTMLIWVLEDNTPSRAFYERMGGVLVEEKQYFPVGTTRLAEVGYGYELVQLIANAGT